MQLTDLPGDPTRSVAPTREDPLARSASEWLGGPTGRHAAIGRQGVRPALVVLSCLATVTMALSVILRGHCLERGWRAGDQFWHACYSDIPVVYQGSSLADGLFAYGRGSGVGQPAGTGLVMWLLARLVPGGGEQARTLAAAQTYFALWAGLLTVLLVLLVAMLVRAMPRTRWNVAHLALSPVVAATALVSFDLLAITLAMAGLVLWGRRRTLEAGLMLGLAMTCRSLPILFLLAIGLLCLRSGRLADWALTAGAALLAAVAVIGGVTLLGGSQALDSYTGWASSQAGYGSVAHLVNSLSEAARGGAAPLSPGVTTAVAVAGWLLALALGALFALGAARRPAVAEVTLLLVVVVCLTGRSLPVQASLWVLPLLAVVGVRWREHLVWAGVEIVYFVAVWLHIAAKTSPDRGLPAGWFAVIALARIAAWAWLAWVVTRRARDELPDAEARPAAAAAPVEEGVDQVETGGAGRPERDPLAGVMAGAPDRVLLKVV